MMKQTKYNVQCIGYIEIVRLLFENCANITLKTKTDKETALQIAIRNGKLNDSIKSQKETDFIQIDFVGFEEIVQLLADNGAATYPDAVFDGNLIYIHCLKFKNGLDFSARKLVIEKFEMINTSPLLLLD